LLDGRDLVQFIVEFRDVKLGRPIRRFIGAVYIFSECFKVREISFKAIAL